jgi:tetratricopeptide (TPR) repeat protein
MASNVNLRTAASFLAELAKDVEEYKSAFVHDSSKDDGGLIGGLIGAGMEEARIRNDFKAISAKVAQIIELASKAKDQAVDPADPSPDSLISDSYYYMGHAYRLRKNLQEAKAQFEKSIAIHPSPDAKYFLAVVLEESGQQQAAKDMLKKIVEEYPDSDRAVEANKRLLKPATSSGCFVATACFGSYDAPEVLVLRQFREQRMSQTMLGRATIRFYYKIGPYGAKLIDHSSTLKALVRAIVLRPIVYALR